METTKTFTEEFKAKVSRAYRKVSFLKNTFKKSKSPNLGSKIFELLEEQPMTNTALYIKLRVVSRSQISYVLGLARRYNFVLGKYKIYTLNVSELNKVGAICKEFNQNYSFKKKHKKVRKILINSIITLDKSVNLR